MIEILSSCWTPGPFELMIIFSLLFIFLIGPVGAGIILLIVYLVRNNKEKKRLKMEVKKLTEEVNQLKDKMK